jgi:3-oxoacyl-[acyl-carrier-protein] synthase III
MQNDLGQLRRHLFQRLDELRVRLGYEKGGAEESRPFADLLDSMGMVEYLAILSKDFATTPEQIEECVGHVFGNLSELAEAILESGMLVQNIPAETARITVSKRAPTKVSSWLSATCYRLPRDRQHAEEIDDKLDRPRGWLRKHAGILQRHVWREDEALEAAKASALVCAESSGVKLGEVGALLVASEAPLLLIGQAPALHHRLGLSPNVCALEVGGACTGFLTAVYLAQALLPRLGPVLIVALEAPSRYLPIVPGPAGEAAALFGDVAAASLLSAEPLSKVSVPLSPVLLRNGGEDAGLIRITHEPEVGPVIQMQGIALAARAIRIMAASAEEVARKYERRVSDLAAIVAHGGNGRMPDMLARVLGVPPERVWSETSQTGNLGSASLPVAWASRGPIADGAVAWTAAGAGLTWGAMLSGMGHAEN